MKIRVGTCGWSFDDWVGVYYPYKLKRTDWIRYYAREFRVAEINSTYYRIPPPRTFESLVQRTPPDFEFFVKPHADVTHKRQDAAFSMKVLSECTKPLRDAKKLEGYVAQFPQNFHWTQGARDYLLKLRELTIGIPLFVEFRHDSWWHDDVFRFLREAELYYISVDEPKLPGLMFSEMRVSRDVLYARLHGRNAEAWRDSSKGDRYNYLYSASELESFGEAALNFTEEVSRIYLLFNNCHAGRAVQNARQLKNWFAEKTGEPEETTPDDNIFAL